MKIKFVTRLILAYLVMVKTEFFVQFFRWMMNYDHGTLYAVVCDFYVWATKNCPDVIPACLDEWFRVNLEDLKECVSID